MPKAESRSTEFTSRRSRTARAWFILLLSIPLVFATVSVMAQRFSAGWETGLFQGLLISGTQSPDGQFAIFSINCGDTSAKAYALATTDRKRLAHLLDVNSSIGRFDQPPDHITFRWNTNSTLLALHDSTPKFSRLQIVQVQTNAATALKLGDVVRRAALLKLKLDEKRIASSGEEPVRWLSVDTLLVGARFKVAGTNAQTEVTVRIREDGATELNGEPGGGVVPPATREVAR
jgi:hypothetical protein